MASTNAPAIAVTVLTYRRNDLLKRLLPALAPQVFALQMAGHPIWIQVVDNDPDGGARSVVDRSNTGVTVRYAHEATPGLSAARNRALDEARDARLLVFIDDDETPGEGWLDSLLHTWERHQGAAAVSGPVVSSPAHELDAWTRGTGLFDRARGRTGSKRVGIATNNLLLDLDKVRAAGVRFDERFGLTGGEDSRFGADLRHAGLYGIWCDEAEVYETVPADRLEREWVSNRLTRFGESWVSARLVDMPESQARKFRAKTAVKGVLDIVQGTVKQRLAQDLEQPTREGRAAAQIAGGKGLLNGVRGINRQEYGR